MPFDSSIQKVLVIGSGPIVIGQAAEFDYAGAQACRVLRDAGVNIVLVNSNPATIMTDSALADEIYLEPLTAATVSRIIEKEKPDSMLASLGGQTGLTIAMQLSENGFLAAHGVRLLGTQVDAIKRAEDRELFKEAMVKIGQPLIPSDSACDTETALSVAAQIGYPVIVRPAFTLGGEGGGVAYSPEELRQIARTGLDASPISQILVERYIYGWKEIEFETIRDAKDNVIAVCSMENVDPVGVHTGDSIVVAPALTLSDKEFQMLRSAAIDIIRSLGIIGGCNCQFALDPTSFSYAVIEVNPRVSRSSALASKATGYPIAKVTAKLALGYTLDEIKNEITGKTCACFEPTLDYVVCKMPKWPFEKFHGSSRRLGTQMKATGEVMAIGTTFEEALLKAVRGAEISLDTLNASPLSAEPLSVRLSAQDDRRIFTVFEAMKAGFSDDEIFEKTRIDRFFLDKLRNLAAFEAEIADGMTDEQYERGKRLGYPDVALTRLSGRENLPATPAVYKMVDTCGAEFDAQTPYFYASHVGACESRAFARSGKPTILVLGSGPIRIGQGIEFDYSSVHCVWTLKKLGYEVAILNNNPETVSTDYDTADRLYFEPLTPEDVMGVILAEKPVGVVVAFGGQTAIRLTKFLYEQGITILGTSAEGIDIAEDREKFDALLGRIGIRRPRGFGVKTEAEALAAAESLGYPVLLRPSYVIGGQNMTIVHDETETRTYMSRILAGNIENPVLVDKYMMGPELEVDVISDGTDVLIPGVMMHIERAGIHSGDSIAVYPPYSINDKMLGTIVDCSEKLALSLGTKGLVNIQYLIYANELYVIEVNPRASRTVPYMSKVTGIPMVDIAARVMTGAKLKDLGYGTGLHEIPPYYAVKVPVFSFAKLADVNAFLGPEMKSTGEVLGIGKTLQEAIFKGMTAAGFRIRHSSPDKQVGVLLSVENHDLSEIVSLAKKLDDIGMKLYATRDTADAIDCLGIEVCRIGDIGKSDDAYRLMEEGKISYIVYTGAYHDETVAEYIALHRRAIRLSIACFSSLDTAGAMADVIMSRYSEENTELVDMNRMRKHREKLRFAKMQGTGDDYIFIDNTDGRITCPESLCISLCDRHLGVGADGIVLYENSAVADARMRIYNADGSNGHIAGNSLRCLCKLLYDSGKITGDTAKIETDHGVVPATLYTRNGKVTLVSIDIGKALLSPAEIPCTLSGDRIVNREVTVDGRDFRITCVSVGNPHCVLFCDSVDRADVAGDGALLEKCKLFPERANIEFVRVVNPGMLKMRVWERGNGETQACGTGACAAVVAACENGLCRKGEEVTVKLRGGDLTVLYTDDGITLTGNANLVYEGETEY